jgi:hypothetical protein
MSIIRVVGYAGANQQLVMPAGYSADATAYLWGGGGGGGGSDARGQGGAGQGGGFVQQTLSLNPGDVLQLAVGGGGGGGVTSQGGGSGTAGASIIPNTLFDTRAQTNASAISHRAWGNFMNSHAMWESSQGAINFTRSYSVYFPYTGYYTFYASVDNYAAISLDGGQIITIESNFTTFEGLYNYTVSQGYHTISFTATNYGGPAGFALVVTNNSINGFSGGRGGVAGPAGSSGGGGGGGGATVLQLNNTVIAVAGGGAGGGGAGNGPNGGAGGGGTTAVLGTTNGQNGQDKTADGGGGGAGGGGWRAGNGGYCGSGDVGGGGGGSSTSYGDVTANPTGRVPGGFNSTYYPGGSVVAYGGAAGNGSAGGPGYTVLELVPHTILVHKDGVFNPALNVYLKIADQWRGVFGVFLKINGAWVPVAGVNSNYAPAFSANTDNFGINARGIDPEATPARPSFQWFGYGNPSGQSGFGGGGGGGGGGGACFTADTLVRTTTGIKPIVDIKVGEQVWNWDGSAVNTVTYIEQTLDLDFVALYTPDADHDCFATINHPLYINGELSSVVPDTVYQLHPWLGRTQQLTAHQIVPATGRSVYNLWTTGDGTYTVNGYGTTSILGDGGLLRLMVEQDLMSAERVAQVLVHFNSQANRNLSQGAYLLNRIMGRLNIKFVNRVFAAVYADDSRTKTQRVFEAVFKAVGRISLLKDRNA